MGRVVQRGKRLTIKAELVKVSDGIQLWGAQYNRELADILTVQEEISKEISEKLRLKLTGQEQNRLKKRYTENTEAYQLYLRGRYHWNKRTIEGLKKSIEYFQQAIEKDPSYALAYAGLADSYNVIPGYGGLPPKDSFPRAKDAARKAVELDDRLAEAHTSLAYVKAAFDWDWSGAEIEFKRALALNANYATARHWYALYLLAVGRLEEATQEMKRALELDPLSMIIISNLGRAFYYARQYDAAMEQYRKALDIDPNFPAAHFRMREVYEQKGMYEQAIGEVPKIYPGRGESLAESLRLAYAASGAKGYWEKQLDWAAGQLRQKYVQASEVAALYARAGQKDKALEWLEKSYQEREDQVALRLKMNPSFDGLRSDPRFQDLLRRVGLSP